MPVVFPLHIGEVFHVNRVSLLWFDFVLLRFLHVVPNSIHPQQQDLRQGKALSTYILLMVAEKLSCMVPGVVEAREFIGVKVCKEALVLSLIFHIWNNVKKLKWILHRYCENSGPAVECSFQLKKYLFVLGVK